MEKKLIDDLYKSYSLQCYQVTPITGGWLNQKWKILTNKGEFLVKQFSHQRFTKEKLKLIEEALQRQIILANAGVTCPSIIQYKTKAIRFLDNETSYLVMEFCLGEIKNSETITISQIQSLGSTCGLMHKTFSLLPIDSVDGYPIDCQQVIDSLWNFFYTKSQNCSLVASSEYQHAVYSLEPILKQLNKDFFNKLPIGIAHEDFTFDNILFDSDGVSAVIDFDRNCYSYLWHDIGRAIMCFAFDGKDLNNKKIAAFIKGYSQHLELTLSDIISALWITCCIETPWWIQPEFFLEDRGKAVRFKDEILWIHQHWFELESILFLDR